MRAVCKSHFRKLCSVKTQRFSRLDTSVPESQLCAHVLAARSSFSLAPQLLHLCRGAQPAPASITIIINVIANLAKAREMLPAEEIKCGKAKRQVRKIHRNYGWNDLPKRTRIPATVWSAAEPRPMVSKSGPLPLFVNKVLSTHSFTHLLHMAAFAPQT